MLRKMYSNSILLSLGILMLNCIDIYAYYGDPCQTANYGGCDRNATCSYDSTDYTVKCSCKTGYAVSGYGGAFMCTDACQAANNGGCDYNATCFHDSTDYTVKCSCKTGYTVSGYGGASMCTDACQTNNGGCDYNATCFHDSIDYTVKCACKTGYTVSGYGGASACTDPCQPNNGGCDPSATCSLDPSTNAVKCTCPDGYITTGSDSAVKCSAYFFGVQHDLNPSLLGYNWALCHQETYDTELTSAGVDSILNECNGSKLLLGCRMVGAPNLKIAAMGDRADVLYDCGNYLTCANRVNGVSWYFSNAFSWGFANAADPVNRFQCDWNSGEDESSRLCWHTGLNDGDGGFRCGAAVDLNHDSTWERVIYSLP